MRVWLAILVMALSFVVISAGAVLAADQAGTTQQETVEVECPPLPPPPVVKGEWRTTKLENGTWADLFRIKVPVDGGNTLVFDVTAKDREQLGTVGIGIYGPFNDIGSGIQIQGRASLYGENKDDHFQFGGATVGAFGKWSDGYLVGQLRLPTDNRRVTGLVELQQMFAQEKDWGFGAVLISSGKLGDSFGTIAGPYFERKFGTTTLDVYWGIPINDAGASEVGARWFFSFN